MKAKLFFLLLNLTLPNIICAQIFSEVSSEKGLNYLYPGNDFQMAGGGVMVIDYNNDGWEDFFQSGGLFDSKLWKNNHGTFEDVTDEVGLDALNGYFIQGAVSADYDNDGYEDFVIANYGVGMSRGDKKSPVLLHNIKGDYFEVIPLAYAVGKGNYASACWGDINKDGFVDLYFANYVRTMSGILDSSGVTIGYNPTCYENKLLINIQGKSFVEQSENYGLNNGGCGLSASFTDLDQDGDLDLLLLNDFGEWTKKGNKFYRNNYPEKKFTDATNQIGFDKKMYGMGIGQGDFDMDGDLDYYITNIGQNSLYENQEGILKDVAENNGLTSTFVRDSIRGTSWSGLFFDLEFDGDLDLYISKGNVAVLVPKTIINDPNKLFINENDSFKDVTDSSGLNDVLSHRGAAIFDFDRDGDLDIVSSVVKMPWAAFARKEQKLKLFQNNVKPNNWIAIKLVGSGTVNKSCIGCKVLFEHNGRKMMREVDGGSGQSSQGTKLLYFGLNKSKKLDKATIFWTDGTQTELKKLRKGVFLCKKNDL